MIYLEPQVSGMSKEEIYKAVFLRGPLSLSVEEDPVVWGVNAKASRMLGLAEDYEYARKNYQQALKNSSFWQAFFEIYNVSRLLGLPEDNMELRRVNI